MQTKYAHACGHGVYSRVCILYTSYCILQVKSSPLFTHTMREYRVQPSCWLGIKRTWYRKNRSDHGSPPRPAPYSQHATQHTRTAQHDTQHNTRRTAQHSTLHTAQHTLGLLVLHLHAQVTEDVAARFAEKLGVQVAQAWLARALHLSSTQT